MRRLFHAGAAAPGLAEVSTLPWVSTAAQKDTDGQETPLSGLKPSIWASVQVGLAAPGSLEIATFPVDDSVETQKDADTQATADCGWMPSMSVSVQVGLAAVGSFETSARPWSSTNRQKAVVGQLTALGPSPISTLKSTTSAAVQVGVAAVGLVVMAARSWVKPPGAV